VAESDAVHPAPESRLSARFRSRPVFTPTVPQLALLFRIGCDPHALAAGWERRAPEVADPALLVTRFVGVDSGSR
jgi:hypothetical protein